MRWLRRRADRHRVPLAVFLLSLFLGGTVAWYSDESLPSRAHARYDVAEPAASPLRVPPPLEPSHVTSRRGEDALARDPMGASFARGKVISGVTPHRVLLFTFDDGPSVENTPRLLDILDKYGVRALFFLSSGRLQDHSARGRARIEVAREIAARGHMIGDHTVDHALLTNLSSESVIAQLAASRELFVNALGVRPWLFRPPGGARSKRVDALVSAEGYTQVLWNLGAADTEQKTKEALLEAWRRTLDRKESGRYGRGGVVLLHDLHDYTVDAVPLILDDVRRRNCELLRRGEELYDIVDDLSFFYEPEDVTDPSAVAGALLHDDEVLAARQARLRREAVKICSRTLEDPTGQALEGFYSALTRLEAGDAGGDGGHRARARNLVRVTHMGDSGIDADQLPHFMRRRFQERFGDGGAGFVLLQPASSNYRNRMVDLRVDASWKTCSVLSRCDSAGQYGLGGVVARAAGRARTRIRTRDEDGLGQETSFVELAYAVQPGGGGLRFGTEGSMHVLPTDASALDDRWFGLEVTAGPQEVLVEPARDGPVRAYGVVLETDGPGVVWDSLSVTGAFTVRMLEQEPEHFARHLHHRRSDLVILHFGGNDLRRVLSGTATLAQFREETRTLLARVRAARPGLSCLLTGITDHGKSGPLPVRSPDVEAMVAAQREAARQAGCAFFDAYRAMGGAGSIHRWLRDGLAAGDLVHLTASGRRRLADWLYEALMAGYAAYRTEHPETEAEERDSPELRGAARRSPARDAEQAQSGA